MHGVPEMSSVSAIFGGGSGGGVLSQSESRLTNDACSIAVIGEWLD